MLLPGGTHGCPCGTSGMAGRLTVAIVHEFRSTGRLLLGSLRGGKHTLSLTTGKRHSHLEGGTPHRAVNFMLGYPTNRNLLLSHRPQPQPQAQPSWVEPAPLLRRGKLGAGQNWVSGRNLSRTPSMSSVAPPSAPIAGPPAMEAMQGAGAAGVGKRKKRKYNPEAELRKTLDLLSKRGDVEGALEFYDKHRAAGSFTFQQYHYNILLYLCASAASGGRQAEHGGVQDGADAEAHAAAPSADAAAGDSISVSEEVQLTAGRRGLEILCTMREAGVPMNEAALTSAARLAAAQGDGEQAFAHVREMQALGIVPRLRSFGPALFAFCQQGHVERAFAVDEHMTAAGVRAGEEELAGLLVMCSRQGLAGRVYALLHRLRSTARELQPTTVDAVQEWFHSQAAAAASPAEDEALNPEAIAAAVEAKGGGWHGLGWLGRGPWKAQAATVQEGSRCSCCGERLVTIDLDPAETDAFARSVARIACERESRPNDFKQFEGWLDRHGPFEAVVDAANIGLANQNFVGGGFNFWQVHGVVNEVRRLSSAGRPPLVILHHRRTKGGPAAAPFAQQCLSKYRQQHALYTTPSGSNDDWYWLYAAVRYQALLVTNDEMRDHIFQLLGNDFFPTWKERHQVRYSLAPESPQLHMPPPYSIVVQESASGAWHFPRAGSNGISAPREWLCVSRQQPSGEAEAAGPLEASAAVVGKDPSSEAVSTGGGEAGGQPQQPSPVGDAVIDYQI